MRTSLDDLVGEMIVDGSVDNDLFFQNQRFEREFQQKWKEASSKVGESITKQRAIDLEKQEILDSRKAHLQNFQIHYPKSLFTRFKLAGQNPEAKTFLKEDGTGR